MNTPTAKDVAEALMHVINDSNFGNANMIFDKTEVKQVCVRLLELEKLAEVNWDKWNYKELEEEIDALKSQLAQARQLIEADNAALKLTEQRLATSQARCAEYEKVIESIHSTALSAEIKTGDKDEILGICDEALAGEKDKDGRITIEGAKCNRHESYRGDCYHCYYSKHPKPPCPACSGTGNIHQNCVMR
jgi:hypothetical protein